MKTQSYLIAAMLMAGASAGGSALAMHGEAQWARPTGQPARAGVATGPIAPGIYEIRPLMQPDICVFPSGLGHTRTNFWQGGRCNATVAILPFSGGRQRAAAFTVRPVMRNVDGLPAPLTECATRARGALLGAPSIDNLPCTPHDRAQNLFDSGAADQKIFIQPVGTDLIRLAHDDGRCWEVRGALRGPTPPDLIAAGCNDAARQRFQLVWKGDLSTLPEAARWVAATQGRVTRAAARPSSPRGRDPIGRSDVIDKAPQSTPTPATQARLQQGYNYFGWDYEGFDTADDGGAQCLARCQADNRCRTMTWVKPGVQGGSASCWLKDRVGDLSRDENTVAALVRP